MRKIHSWVYHYLYAKNRALWGIENARPRTYYEYQKITGGQEPPCGWCGARVGTEDQGDGWNRCKSCGGN